MTNETKELLEKSKLVLGSIWHLKIMYEEMGVEPFATDVIKSAENSHRALLKRMIEESK